MRTRPLVLTARKGLESLLMDTTVQHDLRTIAKFIDVYCRARHADAAKTPTRLKGFDVDAIAGKPLRLCAQCNKLLTHAFVKRSVCPMHPKPACKHCPAHCYTASHN